MAEPAFELRSALTYATHDGAALQGDLHLPSSRGKVPALVAVHGGGWQQGARNPFQHWGSYLAARGHALFSISYRFARKSTKAFPEAVRDVLAAVGHLRGDAAALDTSIPPASGCSAPRPAPISRRWRRWAAAPHHSPVTVPRVVGIPKPVVSRFELLIATFAAPHNLSGDVTSMIRRL
jgi:hypothetical protein